MILHGIEYQRPTSLNMRILADHVTYSFLAFMKSIFHFCLGCYCGGYSQNGRSNLSSYHWEFEINKEYKLLYFHWHEMKNGNLPFLWLFHQIKLQIIIASHLGGPCFNIKTILSRVGISTITRPSHLYSGNSYTGKMTSLYWKGSLVAYVYKIWVKQKPRLKSKLHHSGVWKNDYPQDKLQQNIYGLTWFDNCRLGPVTNLCLVKRGLCQ